VNNTLNRGPNQLDVLDSDIMQIFSQRKAAGTLILRMTRGRSSWEWKRTPLWAGIAGAFLEELKPTGLVVTVREPQAGVHFALRDDLRGSPNLFQGNSDMGSDRATTVAARAWTCDSNKCGTI
jgi:hypothetical protein